MKKPIQETNSENCIECDYPTAEECIHCSDAVCNDCIDMHNEYELHPPEE
jgi:hypothetical protein